MMTSANPPIQELTVIKKDIRSYELPQLRQEFTDMGESAFRANQVYQWLWQKNAHSFAAMTNLSKPLRDKLNDLFIIKAVSIAKQQHSNDGTIKLGFALHDAHLVEGVLIPADNRMTACVSSQVGCSLACKFCATGKMARIRNLNADEIVDQVYWLNQQAQQYYNLPLSNIVYMGMGEPMLNYKNMLRSLHLLTSATGANMAAWRITVSTAGVGKIIKQFADDDTGCNLALSLHAANDYKRNQIMDINETNSLAILAEALQYYYKKTNQKVTYEYIAFNGFNDNIEDARDLVKFCQYVPCKVNIIEYNQVEGVPYHKSSEDRLTQFQNYLMANKVNTTVRRSRGKDIDAACGQLANKN